MAEVAEVTDSDLSSEDEIIESNPLTIAGTAGAKLSTPQKAAISRKRKLPDNIAGKKNYVRGTAGPDVSLWHRVKEFQNEHFTVQTGQLWCNACREALSRKKSSLQKHVTSQKHVNGKVILEKGKKKDQNIRELMSKHNTMKGSTLPEDMKLYRYELVEILLKAGIPLAKVDMLRPFLEKYGHRLTARSHLSEFIPLISKKEKELLKKEIAAASGFSVIFDGSTRLGEALAIVVRFVDEQYKVQQRLIRLEVLARSLNAEQLAQRLIQCLAVDYGITPPHLLAAMRDSAAVNEAALRQIGFYFPNMFNVKCFSHTIDNAGKHFEFSVLDTFSRYWSTMFALSPAARLAWKTKTGTSMKLKSDTRWWSLFEVLDLVSKYYGDVEPFLRENDLSPMCRAKLLEIFDDPEATRDLEMELAAMIDAGRHFVCATYYLEGDGPLVFSCYERLSTLAHAIAIEAYPNAEAKARQHAGLVQELPNYLASADGTVCESEDDKVRWWSDHVNALPNWSATTKKILLVQPSSASAERVFSMLQNAFNHQQDGALEETLEVSVMLRYNGNKRNNAEV
ncbi:hypothetical protein QZH41_002279 [Actinostola sp. cb2023]|nr:hypothetical protein QZH41_002279 [Actinostola sp. cb2023]